MKIGEKIYQAGGDSGAAAGDAEQKPQDENVQDAEFNDKSDDDKEKK